MSNQYHNMTPDEAERLAYASGDTATAELLAKLDDADALIAKLDDADALIADLLAALTKARAWIAQYENTPGHDAAAQAALAVIDRAIAKAEWLS